MLDKTLSLPEDPEELRSFTARLLAEVKAQAILIEKLRHQLAGHRAHRFCAPAAWYRFSGDRKGQHPKDHLGVGLEVVVAQGLQTLQHGVDLSLGGDEGVECLVILGGVAGGHGGASLGELHRSGANTIALTGG